MPYFATRPDVTRVTITNGSGPGITYGLQGPDGDRLEPLGKGWHAVSVGGGLSAPLTLRAYNSACQLIDTETETFAAAQPTPSHS